MQHIAAQAILRLPVLTNRMAAMQAWPQQRRQFTFSVLCNAKVAHCSSAEPVWPVCSCMAVIVVANQSILLRGKAYEPVCLEENFGKLQDCCVRRDSVQYDLCMMLKVCITCW